MAESAEEVALHNQMQSRILSGGEGWLNRFLVELGSPPAPSAIIGAEPVGPRRQGSVLDAWQIRAV